MNQNKTLSRLAFISVGLIGLGGSALSMASYQIHAPGPLLTLGKVTSPSTILSVTGNPAGGELLLHEDEDFRMGYFSSLGIDIESGDVDNFIDDVDELVDALDEDDLTLSEALEIKKKFDTLLPVIGEDARVTVGLGLHAPLAPFAIRSEWLGGVVTFDIQAAGVFDTSFLDAPLDIQLVGSDINLTTSSALYVKGGSLLTGSVGYSREVWQPQVFDIESKLYAGFQTNVYKASLNKQVIALESILDDEDVGDVIRDEFDENTVDTTQIGLDLGLLWVFPYGQVGVTFANINEPEFDYGDIGKNCINVTDPTRQSNCIVAQTFSGEIALSETAVMAAKTTIEGSFYTRNKHWLLSGAADLNSTFDLVGRESQYISTSASYFSDSYLVPNVRLGLSQNLSGSELTMVGFGTTLFGVFNLDVSASLDQIEVDGNKVPRYFGLNIGIEEKF